MRKIFLILSCLEAMAAMAKVHLPFGQEAIQQPDSVIFVGDGSGKTINQAITEIQSGGTIYLWPGTYNDTNSVYRKPIHFVALGALGSIVWDVSDTIGILYATDSTSYEGIQFQGDGAGVLVAVGAGKPIFRNCVIACSTFDFGTDSAWVYDSQLYPLKKDDWTVSSYTQLYNCIIGQDTPMRAATAGWDSVGGFVVGVNGVVAAHYSTFMQKADTSIECNADGKTLLYHCRIINDHYASLCTGGSGTSCAYWTYFETGTQAVPAVVCYDSTSLVLENCEIRTTYAAFDGAALSLISGDVSSKITNYIRDCSIQGNIRVDSSRSFPLVVYANAIPAVADFQGTNIKGGPTMTNITESTKAPSLYSFGYMLGIPFKNMIKYLDACETGQALDTAVFMTPIPSTAIIVATMYGGTAGTINMVKIVNANPANADCVIFKSSVTGVTYAVDMTIP